MNLNEFVDACGNYTRQKQKLASLILDVKQESISLWLKKGFIPPKPALKVNRNSMGLIRLNECNPILRNIGPKIHNPKTVLKQIINDGIYDVIFYNEKKL